MIYLQLLRRRKLVTLALFVVTMILLNSLSRQLTSGQPASSESIFYEAKMVATVSDNGEAKLFGDNNIDDISNNNNNSDNNNNNNKPVSTVGEQSPSTSNGITSSQHDNSADLNLTKRPLHFNQFLYTNHKPQVSICMCISNCYYCCRYLFNRR